MYLILYSKSVYILMFIHTSTLLKIKMYNLAKQINYEKSATKLDYFLDLQRKQNNLIKNINANKTNHIYV